MPRTLTLSIPKYFSSDTILHGLGQNSTPKASSKEISLILVEELQHRFETELADAVKQPSTCTRNFLGFCSYQSLNLVTAHLDYLSDKEFRCLTFEMMLAWEAPGVKNETPDTETASCSNQEVEDEDEWSLFYSSSTKMAVQVDSKKTVGTEAFTRIALASAFIADIITVHNLFDALTSSSGHRLHFLIYDKYLRTLEKYGRSTLTNYALYFESLGVGLYDKAVRYDMAMDMKQVIRPELTGPLGARLFDEAVMYKSTSMYFPEFKGNSRQDYWLDVCLEVLRAHWFIRKYNLKGIQQSEALARAILDVILETLSIRLALLKASACQRDSVGVLNAKQGLKLPVSVLTLHRFGLISEHWEDVDGEAFDAAVDVCIGEINPLENAVKQSKRNTELCRWQLLKILKGPSQLDYEHNEEKLSNYFSILGVAFLTYSIIQLSSSFGYMARPLEINNVSGDLIKRPMDAFKITIPPNENAAEQLLTLQEAITQVESLIQAGNITLLKVRALLFAALPQMPLRKASSDRWLRRIREWRKQ
ncbi:unnamed protein product [Camellia sinensis]